MGRPALPGVERYHQGGVSQASHIGETGEFVGLRDYQPGDPVRRIHWRSWAKAGKPVVREHMEEYFVRHALILDTFATGSQTRAFEEAVSLSASLACHILTRESLLDMMFIENRAYSFTAGRGLMQTDKMLEILASVKSAHQRHFSLLGELILSKAHLLCGAICIFLDWDEPRRKSRKVFLRGNSPESPPRQGHRSRIAGAHTDGTISRAPSRDQA